MKLPSGLKSGAKAPGMRMGKLSLKPQAEDVYEATDPLADVVPTGNDEIDSKAELNALQLAFKARRLREAERMKGATDSEFWFCVCFTSIADKDKFLAKSKLLDIGDKYLDGYEVAEVMQINMKD